MELGNNIKINPGKLSKKNKYSIVKNTFTILDFEESYKNKEYFFSKESIYSDYILIILSSQNEDFGMNSAFESIEKMTGILEKYIFLKNEKVSYLEYYIVIKKKDFFSNENIFYQLFALFKFSSIIGLNEEMTKNNLLKKMNRFSFYDVFNFKKWSDIADWQVFFDVQHECGNLNYKVENSI